jgi:hypothetical protein
MAQRKRRRDSQAEAEVAAERAWKDAMYKADAALASDRARVDWPGGSAVATVHGPTQPERLQGRRSDLYSYWFSVITDPAAPAGPGGVVVETARELPDIGPSHVDLPAPGCWTLDLSWSGHRDQVELWYTAS